nr:hypothetical protein [Tanacetum cinerariifolium]
MLSRYDSFNSLMEKDKNFEVNSETWTASNDVGSRMDDSDSKEVENVFIEDNGKPMDGLVNDVWKKMEAHPKKTPRKTDIWSGRKTDSSKRNVAFSSEMKVHYFDRDDMIFDDLGHEVVSHLHRGKGVFNLVDKVGPVPLRNESITFDSSTGPSNIPPNLGPFDNYVDDYKGQVKAEKGVEVMTRIEPSYVPDSSGQHYHLAGVTPR